MFRIQNITVLTDDQYTKHSNSANKGAGYKTYQQYKQKIHIQNITTVLKDNRDITPNNSTNKRS